MITCSSKKTCFKTREEGEQELINIRARNNYAGAAGPINIYECHICGFYHFTSKGEINPKLLQNDVKKKINLSSEAAYWNDKLK